MINGKGGLLGGKRGRTAARALDAGLPVEVAVDAVGAGNDVPKLWVLAFGSLVERQETRIVPWVRSWAPTGRGCRFGCLRWVS